MSLRAGQAGAVAVRMVPSMWPALSLAARRVGCGTAHLPLPASTRNVPVLVPCWRNNGSREAAVLWQHRAFNPEFIPLEVRLFDLMHNGSHVYGEACLCSTCSSIPWLSAEPLRQAAYFDPASGFLCSA